MSFHVLLSGADTAVVSSALLLQGSVRRILIRVFVNFAAMVLIVSMITSYLGMAVSVPRKGKAMAKGAAAQKAWEYGKQANKLGIGESNDSWDDVKGLGGLADSGGSSSSGGVGSDNRNRSSGSTDDDFTTENTGPSPDNSDDDVFDDSGDDTTGAPDNPDDDLFDDDTDTGTTGTGDTDTSDTETESEGDTTSTSSGSSSGGTTSGSDDRDDGDSTSDVDDDTDDVFDDDSGNDEDDDFSGTDDTATSGGNTSGFDAGDPDLIQENTDDKTVLEENKAKEFAEEVREDYGEENIDENGNNTGFIGAIEDKLEEEHPELDGQDRWEAKYGIANQSDVSTSRADRNVENDSIQTVDLGYDPSESDEVNASGGEVSEELEDSIEENQFDPDEHGFYNTAYEGYYHGAVDDSVETARGVQENKDELAEQASDDIDLDEYSEQLAEQGDTAHDEVNTMFGTRNVNDANFTVNSKTDGDGLDDVQFNGNATAEDAVEFASKSHEEQAQEVQDSFSEASSAATSNTATNSVPHSMTSESDRVRTDQDAFDSKEESSAYLFHMKNYADSVKQSATDPQLSEQNSINEFQ